MSVFLALALLLTAVQLLLLLGRYFDLSVISPAELAPYLAVGLQPTLLIAAIVAALSLLFRFLRLTHNPTAPLMALWITLAATLYAAVLVGDFTADRFPPRAPTPRVPAAGTLLRLPHAAVYIDEAAGLELRRVLLWQETANPGFSLHLEAIYEPSTERLYPLGSESGVPVFETINGQWTMFEPPPVLSRLITDLYRTSAALGQARRTRPAAGYLTLLSLALIVTLSWVVVRLTRWPLFNAMLVLGWIRLLLRVAPVPLDPGFQQPLLQLVPMAEQLGEFLYPAVLATVAVLLLLISIVTPSFDRWKREVRGG